MTITKGFMFGTSLISLGLFINSAHASIQSKNTELEGGIELAHFRYNETVPDAMSGQDKFFMRDTGYFAGIAASWGYYGPYMVKLDGTYKAGYINYTSAGTGDNNGILDHLFDLRGLAGWNFTVQCARVTPYIGFGYRYLYDNFSNDSNTTSTNAVGYDREANYFYSPLGVEFERSLNDLWSVGASAEYDMFWHGIQISHLEQIDPNATMLLNRQNNGYGARGSLRFIRNIGSKNRQVIIEPYIRYWQIDKSEDGVAELAVSRLGNPLYVSGVEPDNTTTEYGLKLALRFLGL